MTVIDIDLTQLKKDFKEMKQITDLIESKAELLDKYKIVFTATSPSYSYRS